MNGFWISGLMAAAALLLGCQPNSTLTHTMTAATDYERARQRMVQRQLMTPDRGITNEAVLKAMGTVPRHEFVPESLRDSAYEDYPLPIGFDQTISQPYIVAFMTQQLAPKATDRVLEVGTGSGYQAAVLAKLVEAVYSIEIVEPLAARASVTLRDQGYTNVLVRAGDGYQGWKEHAPYDAIIVTCAPNHIPEPLVEQLKEGGRMIIPVGSFANQELVLLTKREGNVHKDAILPVRFVPMTGER